MIRTMILHQFPGNPLGIVPNLELLDGEGVAVVGAVVDAEDLEPRAVVVGMGKDGGGHGRPFPLRGDSIIYTALAGPRFASAGQNWHPDSNAPPQRQFT